MQRIKKPDYHMVVDNRVLSQQEKMGPPYDQRPSGLPTIKHQGFRVCKIPSVRRTFRIKVESLFIAMDFDDKSESVDRILTTFLPIAMALAIVIFYLPSNNHMSYCTTQTPIYGYVT